MKNNNMTLVIKDLVKDKVVNFHSLRAGIAYYTVEHNDGQVYKFPVPLNDVGEATLEKQDKAMLFMRWIRKALETSELVKI